MWICRTPEHLALTRTVPSQLGQETLSSHTAKRRKQRGRRAGSVRIALTSEKIGNTAGSGVATLQR